MGLPLLAVAILCLFSHGARATTGSDIIGLGVITFPLLCTEVLNPDAYHAPNTSAPTPRYFNYTKLDFTEKESVYLFENTTINSKDQPTFFSEQMKESGASYFVQIGIQTPLDVWRNNPDTQVASKRLHNDVEIIFALTLAYAESQGGAILSPTSLYETFARYPDPLAAGERKTYAMFKCGPPESAPGLAYQ